MKTKEEILDQFVHYTCQHGHLDYTSTVVNVVDALKAMEELEGQFNKPPVYGQTAEEYLRDNTDFHENVRYHLCDYSWDSVIKWMNEFTKQALPPSPGSVDVEEKKEYCDGTFYCSLDSTYNSDGTCGGCGKKKRNGVDGLGDSSGSEKNYGHECEYYLLNDVTVHSCECENITVSDGILITEYVPLKKYQADKSVKEVSREGEIAELHEKLEEITFYEEEARRQIGIRDQLLEDIFYNRLKPEVIKHKIDQILNIPF